MRLTTRSLLLSFSALSIATPAHAAPFVEPEVVVSATRTPLEISRVASSVTVITSEEIERRQKPTVLELLRTVPGVTVAASGGAGQTARVFLRGMESRHTLLMVDGVVMNDPSDPAGAFDFAYLTTDNVDRIEVLRGPQSTLYGADAVAGVIQIFTKRGEGKPTVNGSVEYGSFDTRRARAGSSGKLDRFDYTIQASRLETDGISAFSAKSGGTEDDPHTNTTVSGSVNAQLADNFGVGLSGRFTRAFAEFDDFGSDSENRTHADIYNIRGTANWQLFDNRWEQELALGTAHTLRDSITTFGGASDYDGDRQGFEWLNHFRFLPGHIVSLGVAGDQSSFDSNSITERDMQNRSLYVQDQFDIGKVLFLTAGARIDDNSSFGSQPTWRLTAAYHIGGPDTKIKASCGSGYQSPSLFQLFDPIYGTSTLKPEKTRGCDAGFEKQLMENRLTLSSTAFYNELSQMIDFDFSTFRYNNIARANTKGVENVVSLRATPNLMLTGTYTFLLAEDANTTYALTRRPQHQFTGGVDYGFLEGKGNVGAQLRGVGDRPDFNLSFDRASNPFFYTVDVNGSYQIHDKVKIYSRLENLFDRQYEEVMTYGSAGFAAYAGIAAGF